MPDLITDTQADEAERRRREEALGRVAVRMVDQEGGESGGGGHDGGRQAIDPPDLVQRRGVGGHDAGAYQQEGSRHEPTMGAFGRRRHLGPT